MQRPAYLIPALLFAFLALLAPGPATAEDGGAGPLEDLPGLGAALGDLTGSSSTDEPEPVPGADATPEPTPEPTPRTTPEAPEPPSSHADDPDVELPQVPALDGSPEAPGTVELRSVVRVHRIFHDTDAEEDPDPEGTCPDATTCEIHEVGRARWPTDPDGAFHVRYRYNDSGRPDGRAPAAGSVRSLARFSAREWMRWNPNVNIAEAGTTDAPYGRPGDDGSCADGVNVVGWEPLGSGAAGVTKVCYDPDTFVIRDVDMALNSQLDWANLTSEEVAGRAFDVRAVLTHEFGHWLSLFDLRMAEAEAQTMYFSSRPGEIRKRTLARGDVLGSRAAYPCGPEDRCSLTGILDD